jgi:hypothetical protein
VVSLHPSLIGFGIGTLDAPPHSRVTVIHWALDHILQEINKEANKLVKSGSPFHCPIDWSWDSLQQFSLSPQTNIAAQQSPVIWSVLTTIAVSQNQRQAVQREAGGDRDPWQVMSFAVADITHS